MPEFCKTLLKTLKKLNKRNTRDNRKKMLMNYIMEKGELSLLVFFFKKNKIVQTTRTNPEPHTISMQEEKTQGPSISAEQTKYRH